MMTVFLQEHEEKYTEGVEGYVRRDPRTTAAAYTCLNHPGYKDYLVAHSTLPGISVYYIYKALWF